MSRTDKDRPGDILRDDRYEKLWREQHNHVAGRACDYDPRNNTRGHQTGKYDYFCGGGFRRPKHELSGSRYTRKLRRHAECSFRAAWREALSRARGDYDQLLAPVYIRNLRSW